MLSETKNHNPPPPFKLNGRSLNNQFQKAFCEKTEITDQEFRTRCEMQGNFPTMPDTVFTENGITKLLANLNPYKAAGLDNIMLRVLKKLPIEISPILTLIFNKSYGVQHMYVQYTKRGRHLKRLTTGQCP